MLRSVPAIFRNKRAGYLLTKQSRMRNLVLLLLWTLAASAQTVKLDEPSSIEGRVLNAITSEPVGKVSLLLMRTDPTQPSFDWSRSYGAASDACPFEDTGRKEIAAGELSALLEGIDLSNAKRRTRYVAPLQRST